MSLMFSRDLLMMRDFYSFLLLILMIIVVFILLMVYLEIEFMIGFLISIMDSFVIPPFVRLVKQREIIEFLLQAGIIEKNNNLYEIGSRDIHLSSDSPMISKHHTNWRMKAISSLDAPSDSDDGSFEDMHYSGIISVTEKDAKKIKDILIKSIQKSRKIISESDTEEIFCYTLDMFKI